MQKHPTSAMVLIQFDPNDTNSKLWLDYVAIDYSRLVPEKGYKGYRTFVEDQTGAIAHNVVQSTQSNSTNRRLWNLEFLSGEHVVMFLLEYG